MAILFVVASLDSGVGGLLGAATCPHKTGREMNISDLTFDSNNANKGTERGNRVLEASLQRFGVGRSILVDKNGTIIAVNKTAEDAGQVGIENVKLVKTTGNEVVAVMRTDLDLTKDPDARQLALADNRVGELSLDYDLEVLGEQLSSLDMSQFWSDTEIERLFASATLDFDAGEEPMPGDVPENDIQMIYLYVNPEDLERFNQNVSTVMKHKGVDNVTDAVLAGMEDARNLSEE